MITRTEKGEPDTPNICLSFGFCCAGWKRAMDFLFSPLRIGVNCFTSYFKDLPRHLARASASNVSMDVFPSEDEVKVLHDRGIGGKYAHNFLVWRRSSIYLIILPLLVRVVLYAATRIGPRTDANELNKELGGFLDAGMLQVMFDADWAIQIARVLIQFLAICAYGAAAVFWDNYKVSRALIRVAWLIFFLSPFMTSLIPYYNYIDINPTFNPAGNNPDPQVQALAATLIGIMRPYVKLYFGASFGVYLFVEVGPPAIMLFLSFYRTSLKLRSLMPQNPLFGYLCAFIPLLTAPLVWLSIMVLIQIIGNYLLLVGLLVFCLAPLVFVVFRAYTINPTDSATAVARSKWVSRAFLLMVLIAAALIIAYVATTRDAVGIIKQVLGNPMSMADRILAIIANYFSGAVFGCDVFLTIAVGIWHKMGLDHPSLVDAVLASPDQKETDLYKDNFARMGQLSAMSRGTKTMTSSSRSTSAAARASIELATSI
eukprot:TRINITY_DN8886_c0_g1_i3.p1 TRINITY_DN8886_c0_g1~~TRINITY_DN8886_c0_g1_i3.p1  ORF type:complete len:485 (-),score=74.51 TRINITY_DN8886_c0_g1_i3:27-1481(-)